MSWLLLSVAAGAQQRVALSNSFWTLTIQPKTLQVMATTPGRKASFLLSAAQQQPETISHLKTTPILAEWELPKKRITVSMRLEGDTLLVSIRARRAGEFTWPLLPPQSAVHGYILPTFEGVYAPAHDSAWSDYLAKRDGLSTTEGLALPLWGLDIGDHTLTYLLTNPFNNELVFQNIAGSLAARFTHRFTQRWKVKEYQVRISLGAPSPIEPARRYRRWLQQTGQFVSMREKIARVPEAARLLGAAHVYLWGDGISPEMMETLHVEGFDRLWLGADGWDKLRDSPETIAKAKEFGYLIGPYDSYHSIHSPDAKPDETWETAQFDRKLYETGAIVRWNGKKRAGFQRKGYLLSPLVAQPYVEKRVSGLMKTLHCNSWFIDCDAFGEVFDDFSPQHPATQEEDMKARLKRLAWIRDTYHLVIGSEGGSAYAASTLHFAHGMMTPVIGFDDLDLKNPASPYFLGRYAPPNAPTVFFRQAPLKPAYYRFFFDPRFRLPLYQTAFHDSVIATHHWSAPSLKFSDQISERALLELLYGVPPLYHLNRQEFARQSAWMKAQYAFFSPLHKETALLPLTEFAWLTPDHSVQRTVFGDKLECIANFRSESYTYRGHIVPHRSLLVIRRGEGRTKVFTPDEHVGENHRAGEK